MSAQDVAVDIPSSENPRDGAVSAVEIDERPIPFFVRVRIWLVRAFLVLWVRCFSLSGLYFLGRVFGTLEYLIDYRRRGRVKALLKTMFKSDYSPVWASKVTRQYFMRIRCDKMFYTILDRIPRNKIMKRIKFTGKKHLEAVLAQKKGVYVAICHFGSFHVAGLLGALMGYDIIGVRDPKVSHVRRYIQKKYRDTFPEIARMKMFYSGAFPREIYRQLKSGGIVASLADVSRQRGQLRTVPVKIFGETRTFLTGPLQIAIRVGAQSIQCFVVSRRKFYYQLIVTPPICEPTGNDNEETLLPQVMQRYADGVEHFAHEYPDHLMNI
jgi:lauroyl/myristoyl acyltransferase